jgi:hypothetical protein
MGMAAFPAEDRQMKRNSPSLKRLERRLAADNEDLKSILSSLLTALQIETQALADMKGAMERRLPIWGEEELPEPKPGKPS